jgi:hypothetical protein
MKNSRRPIWISAIVGFIVGLYFIWKLSDRYCTGIPVSQCNTLQTHITEIMSIPVYGFAAIIPTMTLIFMVVGWIYVKIRGQK